MQKNLLSMGQLIEKVFTMELKDSQMKVYESKSKVILKAPLSSNMTFKIDIQVAKLMNLSVVVQSDTWLWHLRFGHMNFKSLSRLKNKQMVHGLLSIRRMLHRETTKELILVSCCHQNQ